MIHKNDLSFATIPAILLWITNVIHGLFTFWAISVGGSGLEMMVLLPLCFIQLPSLALLFVAVIGMIVTRHTKPAVIRTAVPMVIYLLQVAVFWLFCMYK